MKRLDKMVDFIPGSAQFRIGMTNDRNAPVYKNYSQPELESDLYGLGVVKTSSKQFRTFDQVNTLSTGDLIFSLISGKSAIVGKSHEGYLFTQNYVKLVCGKELDPKYLAFVLNEDPDVKRQYLTSLQGSIVLKYTVKQMKELKLSYLPDIKKQKNIGKLYFNQLKLQALKEKVNRKETLVILNQLKKANN